MSQQRYAYLIGANGPQHITLQYAERDVSRLADALKGPYCQFKEVKAVIADNRDKGLSGLQQIARQCEPSDTLLVHFSGHAIFDRHLYLLCNNTDCDNLFVTAIDIRTIKDILSDCLAQSKLLILDCCHAKGAYDQAFKGEEDIHSVVRQTAQGSTFAILSACARNERTRELHELDGGSGFLSWALLKACTNDLSALPHDVNRKSLSLSSLHLWIRKALDYVNTSLNLSSPLSVPYLLRDQAVGHDIWLTPYSSEKQNPTIIKNDEHRKKYLEQVYQQYNSITLPIDPVENISLHAIFQPLALQRNPLVAEGLPRDQRRRLLGENSKEDTVAASNETSSVEYHEMMHQLNPLQKVIAEHGEDALNKSPEGRIVVLGNPGTGKTTTLKHMISKQAKKVLEGTQESSTILLPIYLSLADLARSGKTLQSYLVDVVEGMKIHKSFADVLWDEIGQGHAFVALDSLDEVSPGQRTQIIALINSLASDQGNIWIIGSRFTEYKGGQFKTGKFSEWEILAMTPQLKRELAERLLPKIYPLFQKNIDSTISPLEFITLLEKHPQAAIWGENPLLFSLAATVYAKTGGLPSSRAVLYQNVIEALLIVKEPNSISRKHLLRILTSFSLWLYKEKKGRTFTLHDILIFLEDTKGYSWVETEHIAQKIIASGTLDVVANETYGFRHQTFQEYFAAVELAQMLTSANERHTDHAFSLAWSKRTYSRWTEILCLMVGVLVLEQKKVGINVAKQWLQQLAEQNTHIEGDPGGLGLTLMLKSLREFSSVEGSGIRKLEQEMITIWWNDLLKAASESNEKRENRLRMLASDIHLLHTETVMWTIDQLVPFLRDENWQICCTTVKTLGLLGENVPVTPLIQLLDTGSWHLMMAALDALKNLKKSPSLQRCIELFGENDSSIRNAIIEVLDKQKNPLFGEFFVETLSDGSVSVQSASMHALEHLEKDAPISLLLSIIQDSSSNIRGKAAVVLGRLGPYAPVKNLISLLYNQDTCDHVVEALKLLGPHAPISSILEATHATTPKTRQCAATILGGLKFPTAIKPLSQLLKDADHDVREAAVIALESIIAPNSNSFSLDSYWTWHFRWLKKSTQQEVQLDDEEIIEALIRLLKDNSSRTRITAIGILGMIGQPTAITPLIDSLQDNYYRIRCEAVRALGMFASEIPIEVFLNAMQDEFWEVRNAAIETLGTLGQRSPIQVLISIAKQGNTSIDTLLSILRACIMLKQYAPISIIEEFINSDDYKINRTVVSSLRELEQWLDAKQVLSALEKHERSFLIPAIQLCSALPNEQILHLLVSQLELSNNWAIQEAIIEGFANWGKLMPIHILRDMFYDVNKLCAHVKLSDGSLVYYPWAPGICTSILETLTKLEEDIPLDILTQALSNENEVVRLRAIQVIGSLSDRISKEVIFELLENSLEDNDLEIHINVIHIFSKKGMRVSLKRLKTELANKNLSAMAALQRLGQDALLKRTLGEPLVTRLCRDVEIFKDDEGNIFECLLVIDALSEIRCTDAIETLIGVLETSGFTLDERDAAIKGLSHLVKFISEDWFLQKFNSNDLRLIGYALLIIEYSNDYSIITSGIGKQLSIDHILKAFYYHHEEEKVRVAATKVISMIGEDVLVREFLLIALSDTNFIVRSSAIEIVKQRYEDLFTSLYNEANEILHRTRSPGYILGAPLQSYIATTLEEIASPHFDYIEKLTNLLFWPHWQVQTSAMHALSMIHHPLTDKAIEQLLYLRRNSQVLSLRQLADNLLAERLSLETGIEED